MTMINFQIRDKDGKPLHSVAFFPRLRVTATLDHETGNIQMRLANHHCCGWPVSSLNFEQLKIKLEQEERLL